MNRKPWRAFLIIVLTCLVVRIFAVVAVGTYEHLNRVELDKISLSLASGQGFSNAFGSSGEPSTGPTAHYPPVYPLLLSLVYRLCGAGVEGEIGKYALNVLFVCLALGALPLVSLAFGLPWRAGLYAGLFGAVAPIYLYVELRGGEVALVGLMLLAAAVRFRDTLVQPSFRWREAAGHGLLWGVILCTSASAAPALALWAALLVWRHRPPLRTLFCFSAVLAGTILGVLLPWTVRNYLVLGSPILTRSNLGLELQVSNNDFAMATSYENQNNPSFDLFHPNRSRQQRLRYREIGEVQYHQEKRREVVRWILDHPATFVHLTLLRVWYFWTAPARRLAQMAVLYTISGLAAFGLWRLWRTQPIAGMQFAALWLGFSFIYYFVQFENRYRYPLFWSLLLLAGFALTEMSWWRHAENRVIETWDGLRKALPAARTGV